MGCGPRWGGGRYGLFRNIIVARFLDSAVQWAWTVCLELNLRTCNHLFLLSSFSLSLAKALDSVASIEHSITVSRVPLPSFSLCSCRPSVTLDRLAKAAHNERQNQRYVSLVDHVQPLSPPDPVALSQSTCS
jgi:hypothetical protein